MLFHIQTLAPQTSMGVGSSRSNLLPLWTYELAFESFWSSQGNRRSPPLFIDVHSLDSGLRLLHLVVLIRLLSCLAMLRLKSVSNSVHAWTQQGSTSVCNTFWVVFGIDGMSQLPIVCQSVPGYLLVKPVQKEALPCNVSALLNP